MRWSFCTGCHKISFMKDSSTALHSWNARKWMSHTKQVGTFGIKWPFECLMQAIFPVFYDGVQTFVCLYKSLGLHIHNLRLYVFARITSVNRTSRWYDGCIYIFSKLFRVLVWLCGMILVMLNTWHWFWLEHLIFVIFILCICDDFLGRLSDFQAVFTCLWARSPPT